MIEFTASKGEEEFHLIQQTRNPPVKQQTSYIWILSSRHDIYGEHVNCPKKSQNFTPFALKDAEETEACDINDDYERIKAALLIGQKVTALRCGKKINELCVIDYEQHAPLIIYNGWPEQNASFRSVLDKNEFSSLGLSSYPASKFMIFDMPEEQQHTGGQFSSLAKMVETDPQLKNLKNEKSEVTIVTSAYHLPRVRRLFDSKYFKNPFNLQTTQISFYGVDRLFNRPCAQRDLLGELKRLKEYSEINHIGAPIQGDWYNVKSLQAWTPLRESAKEVMDSAPTSSASLKTKNKRQAI
ncbi:MAG: hypothetical protein BGO43_09730 [Gammaproteobacteria bacterium 39-13]|nr:hypothetical protein [Gammaproteobacteria bacterium]OJV93918.1 MAG: hypothetical protein BGO43_09730 [Gammaproteobacteria bacterium 39-13]